MAVVMCDMQTTAARRPSTSTAPDAAVGFGPLRRQAVAPAPLSARRGAKPVGVDLGRPGVLLALLILGTLLARLLFACLFGLGIDESYVVAAGRRLQYGYFDHPPIAWWLAWGSARLFGSDAAVVVRLPFVLLFALSTWLMYQLTARPFGRKAGLWAALALNLAPVFSLADGVWVLPDGPLIAALLGAAFCLMEALGDRPRTAWRWWIGAGVCAGLALCSKYIAVLPLLGALAFFAVEPRVGRAWLRRPHPYVAALIAALMFSPVVAWNAQHHWASFLFQGARGGGRFQPFGPMLSLFAQALFLLPWIWLALAAAVCGALSRDTRDPRRWLLLCLGAPSILVFLALSAWGHVLPHWGCPGYVLLLPLLGDAAARAALPKAWLRIGSAAGAAVVIGLPVGAVGAARAHWTPGAAVLKGSDPDRASEDWGGLAVTLREMERATYPGAVVATLRWFDAGKIDYALHGESPVICLPTDRREYGEIAPPSKFYGRDVLIVAPRQSLYDVRREFGWMFESIQPTDAGRGESRSPLPAVFIGRRLHAG